MWILDSTNKSIEILLSSSVTTNELDWVITYADETGTTFTEIGNDGVTNGTTAVTMVASPVVNTRRIIKEFFITNTDTVDAIVTIRLNNNSNYRILRKVNLAPNATLTMNSNLVGAASEGNISGVIEIVNSSVQQHNVDGAIFEIDYESEIIKDTNYYSHSNSSNPNEVTVLQDGWYKISAISNYQNYYTNRVDVRNFIRINGTNQSKSLATEYSRHANYGQDATVVIPALYYSLTTNDVVTVMSQIRSDTTWGDTRDFRTISGACILNIEYKGT